MTIQAYTMPKNGQNLKIFGRKMANLGRKKSKNRSKFRKNVKKHTFHSPLCCGPQRQCFGPGYRGREYDFGHPEAILSGITMFVF